MEEIFTVRNYGKCKCGDCLLIRLPSNLGFLEYVVPSLCAF
jgi:hypothetical protein